MSSLSIYTVFLEKHRTAAGEEGVCLCLLLSSFSLSDPVELRRTGSSILRLARKKETEDAQLEKQTAAAIAVRSKRERERTDTD
jgi:hypothetical protein